MSLYIIVNPAFIAIWDGYTSNRDVVGFVSTNNAISVIPEEAVRAHPEIFENDTLLPTLEPVELTDDDFPIQTPALP